MRFMVDNHFLTFSAREGHKSVHGYHGIAYTVILWYLQLMSVIMLVLNYMM